MSPSNEPLEEDHVVLRCKADRLIYGNLAWFRVTNISDSGQVPSVRPCRTLRLQQGPLLRALQSSQQGTNVTLELLLPNASRQDEGLYACQVENIMTRERTCLLRRLSLRGKKHALFHTNSLFIGKPSFHYIRHTAHRFVHLKIPTKNLFLQYYNSVFTFRK